MKRLNLISSLIAITGLLSAQEQVEVTTGANYVNDAYYSLETGLVDTVARNTWDLGFTTDNFSISILANTASGVEVYTYSKGDTADWAALDTTGMVWEPLYNSIETWDEGAFSANATGHPDYGWGVYNMVTHNIAGDSLYVIKTVAGTYKKLDIILRNAIANTWEFKFADLNGDNEQHITLNSGEYSSKSFVYYNLSTGEIIDREPGTDAWDMVFTRYWDYNIPYFVTGVFTNDAHILAQEVKESGLDQATFVDYQDTAFSSDISIIGSDWKTFNMATFTYDVSADVVYFLKKYTDWDSENQEFGDSLYYKIYFTAFSGSSEGKYTFIQEDLTPVSINDFSPVKMLEVYPNPTTGQLNLVFDFSEDTRLNIIDIAGRPVMNTSVYQPGGFGQMSLDVSDLKSGIYLLRMEGSSGTEVVRFIKK